MTGYNGIFQLVGDQFAAIQQAECVPSPDVMFPETRAEFADAQAICRRCPSISDCLSVALTGRFDDGGVYGGAFFPSNGKPVYLVQDFRTAGRPRLNSSAVEAVA